MPTSTTTTEASPTPSFTATAPDPRGAPIDPFHRRYGHRLPRELRDACTHMSWNSFMATYGRTGAIAIRRWETTRLPAGRHLFDLTLSVGPRVHRTRIDAYGPAQAMTQALAECGVHMEITSFHQHALGWATTTILRAELDGHRVWAIGFAQEGDEATIKAMATAASSLHHGPSA